MAVKSRYNLVSSKSEYSRYYSEFRGVDLSLNPTDIEPYRLSDSVNMWRDPEAEYGGAVETFPGFRRLHAFDGKINGIHEWAALDGVRRVAVHAGTSLYVFNHTDRDLLHESGKITEYTGLANARSVSFLWQNVLYLLDGSNYFKLDSITGLSPVSAEAYIPISYSDGKEYEQRNMLSQRFANRYGLENLSDYEEIASSFQYIVDDSGNATITGFSDIGRSSATLRIPSTVPHGEGTATVTAIGDGAFCALTTLITLILPPTLISIGSEAFCDCANLTGLYFTNASDGSFKCTTVGEGAFSRCGFHTLALVVNDELSTQETVNVEKGAFSDCASLSTVILSGKILLKESAFSGNTDCCFYIRESTDTDALDSLAYTYKILKFLTAVPSGGETDIFDSVCQNVSTFVLKENYSSSELNELFSKYRNQIVYANGYGNEITVFSSSIKVCTNGGREVYEYADGRWYEEDGVTESPPPPYKELITSIGTFIPGAMMIIADITVLTSCGEASVVASDADSALIAKGNGGCVLYRAPQLSEEYYFALYAAPDGAEIADRHLYKFLIYDPCEDILSVTLDGQDIETVSDMEYSTESDGALISAVNIITDHPELLTGGTLIINGKGTDFKSIAGYSNAIAGNSAYAGDAASAICGCRLAHIFDGRIFLSGNPEFPNTVFYSCRMLNGESSPVYFGILNYFNDGVGNSPVKALTSSSSMLMVLKGDTVSEGSIYYHSGADTGLDLVPRIYPAIQGLAGLGCIADGAACNFLDDCVFVSRRGLEAVGKEQVNLERSIEHRSYNLDAKLPYESLENARLCEWLGYLVLCVGSHWYIADSRQIFEHRSGVYNYEWYPLTGLETYNSYLTKYFTLSAPPAFTVYYRAQGKFNECTVTLESLILESSRESIFADSCENDIYPSEVFSDSVRVLPPGLTNYYPALVSKDATDPLLIYYTKRNGVNYICDTVGERCPDSEEYETPSPCCELRAVGKVLYFGTADGKLCCINNDKRGETVDINGEYVESPYDRIPRKYYAYDMVRNENYGDGFSVGRRYLSGMTLKSDTCDIPHLTKTTRRNSITVRCKSFTGTRFKARCRTDLSGFEELENITASNLDYSDIGFDAASFSSGVSQICIIREHYRNRRWVEQQFSFYSDKYREPFGIYSLAFRYRIGGRIKI